MLLHLLLIISTANPIYHFQNCLTDYSIGNNLKPAWIHNNDTLITQSDTLVLKGLITHTHKDFLAFVGLRDTNWITGLVKSGILKFTRNFKQIQDELSPFVRVSKNGLLLIFPSRGLIYSVDSIGQTRSIISIFQKKEFLYEISLDALPTEQSDLVWVVSSTKDGLSYGLVEGRKKFVILGRTSTLIEKKLKDYYLNSASVVKNFLLISVFSVKNGIPVDYKLLMVSKDGIQWEISSSSVVSLSGSVGNYQLVRIGDLWQLIDVLTGKTYMVFPEIPKKSRTWVMGTENTIIVAWSPLPEMNQICYIVTDISDGSKESNCINETPASNPLQVFNGKVYLKTCSRFLELR